MSRNRGKKKLKLRDLSRQHPTDAEASAILIGLTKNETPIVVAILGAGLVEYRLEQLLRPRFNRRDDDIWEELTDVDGPLSTFAAKITLGYALKIYDDGMRKNLDIVRKIRNVFAHSKRIINFDNELICDELKQITIPRKRRSLSTNALQVAQSLKHKGQISYLLLCSELCSYLLNKLLRRTKARSRYAFRRIQEINRELHSLHSLLGIHGPLAHESFLRELKTGSGLFFQDHQTDDPKNEVRPPFPQEHPRARKEPPGNGDK